jgi:hypothetical protein
MNKLLKWLWCLKDRPFHLFCDEWACCYLCGHYVMRCWVIFPLYTSFLLNQVWLLSARTNWWRAEAVPVALKTSTVKYVRMDRQVAPWVRWKTPWSAVPSIVW